jgi:hypothetical protein
VSKLSIAALAAALMLPLVSHAATDFSVFTCPPDNNGEVLNVMLHSSAGSLLGDLTFNLTTTDGHDRGHGTLTRSLTDNEVQLRDTGIEIKVPRMEHFALPGTQTRVTYQTGRERTVTVVCNKGTYFRSLFMRPLYAL